MESMNGKLLDVTRIKAQYDCREVASRYTTFSKPIEGYRELHGPCPRCGGTDRFWASPHKWGCRVCGKLNEDVIALVRFTEGLEFMDAVQFLDSGAVTQRTPIKPTALPERSFQETDDQRRKRFLAEGPVIMDAAQLRLMKEDTPGGEYLLKRGLQIHTWAAYGLGYVDDAEHRGPAIAMPWYRGGNLTGIRYRLLNPPDPKKKIVSATGSEVGKLLFGGQALTMWTKHSNGTDLANYRTLVLIEGEINAMSVWQTAHGARVDVLSMGSESAKLSDSAIAYAQRFRAVLVWMDKQERAQAAAKLVNGAAFWSEQDGKKTDANDHLQHGTLARLLVRLITKATPVGQQEALRYDLVDGGLATFA